MKTITQRIDDALAAHLTLNGETATCIMLNTVDMHKLRTEFWGTAWLGASTVEGLTSYRTIPVVEVDHTSGVGRQVVVGGTTYVYMTKLETGDEQPN